MSLVRLRVGILLLAVGCAAEPPPTGDAAEPRPGVDAGVDVPISPEAGGEAALEPDGSDLSVAVTQAVYTLDLTGTAEPFAGGERTGPPVFPHNAYALFSIDLATTTKQVRSLSWQTVERLQGKGTCHGFPDDGGYVPDAERGEQALQPYRPDDALKGFRSPYRVRLGGIDLEMPYRVPADTITRVAGAVCVAVRTGSGVWLWRARRYQPVQDQVRHKATVHIDLSVDDVDAVAILFEASTPVSFIRLTVENTSGPSGTLPRGDVATAGCCSACAPDGPDLASRYCCTSGKPQPEPCLEDRTPLSAQCRPRADLHAEATAACRQRGLWLRDYSFLDPTSTCVAADGLSPTGALGVSFKCCRDPHFIPPPPDTAGMPADCQLVGGLASPCRSNAEMLKTQVDSCFAAGLIHRYTVFGNECPGVGSSNVLSVCCRPDAPGPPVDACLR